MASHADCTHEKTKAARAACRAGREPRGDMPKASPRRLIDPDDYPIMRRVDPQTGEPIGPPIDTRKKASDDAAYRPAVMSAFCGTTGRHDACPGGGTQWTCQCECHAVTQRDEPGTD